jgi:hypothetical protein
MVIMVNHQQQQQQQQEQQEHHKCSLSTTSVSSDEQQQRQQRQPAKANMGTTTGASPGASAAITISRMPPEPPMKNVGGGGGGGATNNDCSYNSNSYNSYSYNNNSSSNNLLLKRHFHPPHESSHLQQTQTQTQQQQQHADSDDDDDDDNQKRSRQRHHRGGGGAVVAVSCFRNNNKHVRFLQQHFSLLCVSVLIFAVIAAAGISLSFVFAQHQEQELQQVAMAMATESGEWFAKELDMAILPLFSMAQFATELDIFRTLPKQVEALPFVAAASNNVSSSSVPSSSSHSVKRNVTGVCDDDELVARFASIAHAIKASAGLQGVLVNLQLAPHGVICLLHPMNNTEDFVDRNNGTNNSGSETFLDSTPVWGLDLMKDPKMKYIASQQIKQADDNNGADKNNLGIVGPRILNQCPTCGLYFIVRLVIDLNDVKHEHDDDHRFDDDVMDDHLMWVNGLGYNRWGFATALINWDHLVQRSRMHAMFHERGMSFLLTRTDRIYNDATLLYDEQVQVLAQSDDYGTSKNARKVSKALHTTNNEWVMTVEYSGSNHDTDWSVIVMIVSVVMALCIACLVFVVLIQKQLHTTILGTNMAHEAKVEIERNMTGTYSIVPVFCICVLLLLL